ncbi:prepilin-type N-terminal cleavage/methylation domain-containing protein [Persephonella sp. IF05-L8]|uniref:prepilin-type N-terminal cleavage/methylation domain-containing protein n=1 Tax=Persephonella sp. IF05-L8 TaxID=1158338 RepID=UPI00068B395D
MKKSGFTLLEILIVLSIIAILMAISIPYYYSYKKTAYKTMIKNDVRNTIADVSLFWSNYKVYPQLNPNPCLANLSVCTLSDGNHTDIINKSKGVILELTIIASCPNDSTNRGFEIKGSHVELNNYTFSYNSCNQRFEETQ